MGPRCVAAVRGSVVLPGNDRADNKATYTITVTTEADYRVVATGQPWVRRRRGTYPVDLRRTSANLVLPGQRPRSVASTRSCFPEQAAGSRLYDRGGFRLPRDTAFRQLPEMLDTLEAGSAVPLPLLPCGGGGRAPGDPDGGAGHGTFGTNHLLPGWDNERLVVPRAGPTSGSETPSQRRI